MHFPPLNESFNYLVFKNLRDVVFKRANFKTMAHRKAELTFRTFTLPQTNCNTQESKEDFMEPVQHVCTAFQVCSLCLMGSRFGLTARTVVALSISDENISLSSVPIGKAYT